MVTVDHKRHKGLVPCAVFGSILAFAESSLKASLNRLLVGNESELGCWIVAIVIYNFCFELTRTTSIKYTNE